MRKVSLFDRQMLIEVGTTLKQYRTLNGLSANALGQRTGTNEATIYRVERGEGLTLSLLFRIRKALEITWEQVFEIDRKSDLEVD